MNPKNRWIESMDTPVAPEVKPAFDHTTGPPGAPHITITKLTNGVDAKVPPGPVLVPGDPVTWTYIVENDGGSDFSLVEIEDDQEGYICRLERSGPGGPILPGLEGDFGSRTAELKPAEC